MYTVHATRKEKTGTAILRLIDPAQSCTIRSQSPHKASKAKRRSKLRRIGDSEGAARIGNLSHNPNKPQYHGGYAHRLEPKRSIGSLATRYCATCATPALLAPAFRIRNIAPAPVSFSVLCCAELLTVNGLHFIL